MSAEWQLGSRYTLERQIGSGAMGQVWVGRDVDGRTLAFKLLRPEMADDPTVVSRFLQERNLLVGLRSPYVIRVEDLVIEGPRLAIVMEYIAGSSLRALLQKRGNLPAAEVATLGARIARGLAAVHAAGVLHRDLKPENVLLDSGSGRLEPKIADFGIASLAVTQTGHVATANVIGTPQYLAPELGDGKPSGRASDLYALGITLYEMASGTVPFLAESPVALLRLHADHAPGRPAGIPDPLWALIAALLVKNPSDRPHDATAIAAQLEAMAPHLVGAPTPPALRTPPPTTLLGASPAAQPAPPPVMAQPAPNQPAPGGPDGRRRGAFVALAIVVALCLVGLVTWLVTLISSGSSSGASTPSTHATRQRPSGAAPPSSPLRTPSGPDARTWLASTMTSGAVRRPVSLAGYRDTNGMTVTLAGTGACHEIVHFGLAGRYADAAFVAGLARQDEKAPEGDGATIRVALDGRPVRTVAVTPQAPAHVSVALDGARDMALDVTSQACPTEVALVDATLRS